MSSGKFKTKHPFNKSIMRDGQIVILNKNGTERYRLDKVTREVIKKDK